MTNDERIQAYLDGELSDTDVLAFESELASDETLHNRYDHYIIARDLSKGLLEIDMRKTLENEPKKQSFFSNWLWLIIILSAAGLGVYFLSSVQQEDELHFAEVYTEPIWPINRGDSDSISVALAEWKNTGNLQMAKTKIESINSLDLTMKNYWISEMFLYAGELDSVIFYLPEIQKDHIRYNRFQKIKSWIIEYD